MKASEALAEIRGFARAGRVRFLRHAEERAFERGLHVEDVMNALCNAAHCGWQADHGTWKVRGPTRSADEIAVAVRIDDGVLVVTVFGG